MEPTVTNGRFQRGNKMSQGNPLAKQVGRFRSVLLESVTEADMKAIVGKLVERAKGGDLAAMKLLLDRTCGKSFVDRLPSPKPSTLGLPTHDDNGVALTFEEKKAWLFRRIAHLRGDAGQTEQLEAEHDAASDTDEFTK